MTESRKIHFVCVATGDFYNRGELYINNLYSMLSKHVDNEFSLTCITDKKRNLENKIIQIDCSNWDELKAPGMRATTTKIGLFNPNYINLESFIYLDLTLVIQSNMTPLIKFMQSKEEPLIIIKDWFQDTYNSSVMRIKPHQLQIIYDDFSSGIRYNQKTKGDQEFIYNTIKKHKIENKVSIIPEQFVSSFKFLLRKSLKDKEIANRMLKKSIIIKFHGKPKVHEIANPVYRFLKYGIGNIRHGKIGLQLEIDQLLANWNQTSTN